MSNQWKDVTELSNELDDITKRMQFLGNVEIGKLHVYVRKRK